MNFRIFTMRQFYKVWNSFVANFLCFNVHAFDNSSNDMGKFIFATIQFNSNVNYWCVKAENGNCLVVLPKVELDTVFACLNHCRRDIFQCWCKTSDFINPLKYFLSLTYYRNRFKIFSRLAILMASVTESPRQQKVPGNVSATIQQVVLVELCTALIYTGHLTSCRHYIGYQVRVSRLQSRVVFPKIFFVLFSLFISSPVQSA